jgi:hypothetical protein
MERHPVHEWRRGGYAGGKHGEAPLGISFYALGPF